MTLEEKLNHLNEWMGCWIGCLVDNTKHHIKMIELYNETGLIIYSSKIDVIPFEEYLILVNPKNI